MPLAGSLTSKLLHWKCLVLLSAAAVISFHHMQLPAGQLLGPLLAAIALTLIGSNVQVPPAVFCAAQGIVGCLIARSVPASVLPTLAENGAALIAGVLGVSTLAALLGWLLALRRVLPGDAAIWGSAPGAATAMMLMAEADGADIRLVAFMQYLRVVLVSLTAVFVAHHWETSGNQPPNTALGALLLAPPGSWPGAAITLAVALGGAFVGVRLRVPAGALLVPMFVGILLQNGAHVPVELPPMVLAAAYAFIGWTIGSRFDRKVITICLGALPMMLASNFVLIAMCGALAAGLAHWANVDPLTAYLATSPGGLDVIAIIASSSAVDISFIISMQVLRMLFVLATGRFVVRLLSSRRCARP